MAKTYKKVDMRTYALSWELFLRLEKISEDIFVQIKIWKEFKK